MFQPTRFFSAALCVSAISAFDHYFNPENAEIRIGPQRNVPLVSKCVMKSFLAKARWA
jgi:hypothetical protein